MSESKRLLLTIAVVFVLAISTVALCGWWMNEYVRDHQTVSAERERDGESTAGEGRVTIPLYDRIPRSIDPLNPPNDGVKQMLSLVNEPLAAKREDGTLTGVLAATWELSDDGRKVAVRLREGVSWHDGKPLTADDVSFTYAQLTAERGRSQYSGVKRKRLAHLRKVEKKDPYRVVFRLNQSVRDVEDLLSIPIVPRHAYETSLETGHLIGTGPFKMEKRLTRDQIVLKRRRQPKGESGEIRQIAFLSLVPEQAVRQFVQGQLDALPQMDPVTARRLLTQAGHDREKRSPMVIRDEGGVYHYVAFNRAKPLWNDKKVRQAVGDVLDKRRLVAEWLQGYGSPVDTPRGTTVALTDAQSAAKAKQRLQDKLKNKKIQLHYTSEWIKREELARLLQQMWGEAGCRVQLVKHKTVKQLVRAMKSEEADLVLLADWVRRDADQLYGWWRGGAFKNWRSWPKQDLEEQLKQTVRTEHPAVRAHMLQFWDKRFAEESPFIPLVVPDTLHFVTTRLSGVRGDDFNGGGVDVRRWQLNE